METEENIPEEILEKYPHFNEFLKKEDKYILDENNNVIPADLMTWGKFLDEDRLRRIVKQEMINNLKISTVFIGLDHNLWGNKPHIFETMIFNEEEPLDYLDRYSTWKESEEGHKKAVEWVKNGCKDDER